MHIGKVGGYAISQYLLSHFALGRIHNGDAAQYDSLDATDAKDFDLFIGHFSFRQIARIPKPAFLFSMVRDPVERVLSNYFFLRSGLLIDQADEQAQLQIRLAKQLDLADFIEHPDTQTVSCDHQTYFFGDDWRSARDNRSEVLKAAIANIDDFDLVGINERYDESMQMLCARVGWKPWPADVRLNTTRERAQRDAVDPAILRRIEALNEGDLVLVDRLERRFDKEFRAALRHFVRLSHDTSQAEAFASSKPPETVDLFADAGLDGEGWYPRERLPHSYVRWMGPGLEATATVYVDRGRDLKVEVYAMGWTSRAILDTLVLSVDGTPCARTAYNIGGDEPANAAAAISWLLPARKERETKPTELRFSVAETLPLGPSSHLGGDERFGAFALGAIRLYPDVTNPDSDALAKGKTLLLSAVGRVPMIVEAEQMFRIAFAAAPASAHAAYWVGESLCYQGKLDEAEHFFREALALDHSAAAPQLEPGERGHAHARVGEALLQYDRGHVEARDHLKKAISLLGESARTNAINSPATLLAGLAKESRQDRRREFARWPVKLEELSSLEAGIGHVVAGLRPLSPRIGPKSRIVTLGSCFAMNLGHELLRRNLPVSILGMGELINSTFANRALFEWILDEPSKVCSPTVIDVLKAYFGDSPSAIRQSFTAADIVIFTLGVAPGFFGREDGLYYLSQPGATTRHLVRSHDFRTTTTEENATNIAFIAASLKSLQPNIQIVFSVSPVPLFATFEYSSAMIADCVSKSVLRASIDQVIKQKDPNVHYWPAFEIVRWLGSYTGGVYGGDDGTTRHVSNVVITAIVDAFVAIHGNERLQTLSREQHRLA